MSARAVSLSLLSLALSLAGCGAPEETLPGDELAADVTTSTDPELKADLPSIPATVLEDDTSAAGGAEMRRVIVSRSGYRALFGHDAPGVDFTREWVFFYQAGIKRTGGYKAAVDSIRYSAATGTLRLFTSLDSPGPGCIVTQALSRPNALVRFRIPSPRPIWARYFHRDTVRSCEVKPECRVDADCVIVASYCGGCSCGALPKGQTPPPCMTPPVNCFADPCLTRAVACSAGKCVTVAKCGRTVCGAGQVCCNASCGICTPPDGACIQIACP